MFDDKLHKNEQLWDDLLAQFVKAFPDQKGRNKQSIRNQWDKEQRQFIDWCKCKAAFASGWVSGAGRDEQERILNGHKGPCHDLFLEFKQDERSTKKKHSSTVLIAMHPENKFPPGCNSVPGTFYL